MELVFDMVGAQQFVPGLLTTKTFKQAGGVIGRAEGCDWVIPIASASSPGVTR